MNLIQFLLLSPNYIKSNQKDTQGKDCIIIMRMIWTCQCPEIFNEIYNDDDTQNGLYWDYGGMVGPYLPLGTGQSVERWPTVSSLRWSIAIGLRCLFVKHHHQLDIIHTSNGADLPSGWHRGRWKSSALLEPKSTSSTLTSISVMLAACSPSGDGRPSAWPRPKEITPPLTTRSALINDDNCLATTICVGGLVRYPFRRLFKALSLSFYQSRHSDAGKNNLARGDDTVSCSFSLSNIWTHFTHISFSS
jgi:hypothetical protein